jgi:hypothetical protein
MASLSGRPSVPLEKSVHFVNLLGSDEEFGREAPLIHDAIVGAFVFPEAWADLDAFRALLTDFRSCGVTAVFTESEAYDARAIDAAHELGLRFYAGVACFSDHASNFSTLAAHPNLRPVLETGEQRPQMEWYIGISPADPDHRQSVLSSIGTIATRYEIDGLFLDFVRWPLHWEIELRHGRRPPLDSSFDDATLERFARATGLRLPSRCSTVAEMASWILTEHREEWVDFKCDVITDFVGKARAALKAARTAAELGAFLVPDGEVRSERFTGQRLESLVPLVDWAAPMLYHNILLQPPRWVGSRLDEFARVAGRKTLPVLQADSNRDPSLAADWGPSMDVANWQAVLAEVGRHRVIAGVIVFPGTSLVDAGRCAALGAMIDRDEPLWGRRR